MAAIHPPLVTNGTYSPATLKEIGEAFDEMWTDVAGNFGGGEDEVGAARTRLAHIVLGLTGQGVHEKNMLKQMALDLYRLDLGQQARRKQRG